jgi:hypothetical protein
METLPMFSHPAPTTAAGPPPRRHALGLPAGSVRAMLALAVLGSLWMIALTIKPKTDLSLVFVYLNILMVLILVHYFTAHGHSIGHEVGAPSPLGLPRGSVRLLLLLGYGGMAYYLYHHQVDFEVPAKTDIMNLFMLVTLLLGGFFVGHYLTKGVEKISGGALPFWYQDIQAWTALMAVIALTALLIIHIFINSTVSPEMMISSLPLDTVLVALVGFYFGSR